MESLEFEGWPKTPRLSNSTVTITEKIDGTNACIIIKPVDSVEVLGHHASEFGGVGWAYQQLGEPVYLVGAQSRKRLITPDDDNAGFARYVASNIEELTYLLGPGRHFGEWWGQGIQRRYGMDHKVFSLFNYHRFSQIAQSFNGWRERARDIHMTTVPMLHAGKFSDSAIESALWTLRENGSFASAEWGKSFNRPEGIVIRHSQLGGNLKVLLENDDIPKSKLGLS